MTRKWALIGGVIVVVLLVPLSGAHGRWCLMLADRALESNHPHQAIVWTQRARRWSDRDRDAFLTESLARLRLHQTSAAAEAIASAERAGAERSRLGAHTDLLRAYRGDMSAASRVTQDPGGIPLQSVLFAGVRCGLYHERYAWARSMLKQWESSFPDAAAVAYHRGRIAELREAFDEALGHYAAALEKRATFYPAAFRRGAVLKREGRYDDAVDEFERCATSPVAVIGAIEAADCDWHGGRADRGWNRIEPFAELDYGDVSELYLEVEEFVDEDRAALVAGRILLDRGQPARAETFLRRVLDHNHRVVAARTLLVDALRQQGKRGEAADQAAIADELLKQRRRCADLRGQLAKIPDNVDKRFELARLYWQCESAADARMELQRILSDHPRFSPARELLAKIARERASALPGSATYHASA